MKLYTQIGIGLAAGVIVGLVLGANAVWLEPLGKAFIQLITMVVVPLVFASLVVGTASLGSINKLGRIGGKTIGYYLITTALAVTIGLVLANLIQPGAGLDQQVKNQLLEKYKGKIPTQQTKAVEKSQPADSMKTAEKAKDDESSLVKVLLRIIPTNPIKAMAEGDMLPLIFFSLALGVALTYVPVERSGPFIAGLNGLNDAMIQMVHLIMKVAPFGVFALIAGVTGRFGFAILLTLLKYSLVVLLGLAIHLLGTYGLSVRLLGRMSPIRFFKGMRAAQLVAFSTSSSNATLPVNMRACQENLGVSSSITSFVLPLGATINMDGTALYQGVAAVFIAQVYNIPLELTDQLIIVLTATLASIGAAGVPSAGIVTLTLVLQTIGVPLEGIGLILGVDRILDMCRTVVNITGDATCAVFIARTERELLQGNASDK